MMVASWLCCFVGGVLPEHWSATGEVKMVTPPYSVSTIAPKLEAVENVQHLHSRRIYESQEGSHLAGLIGHETRRQMRTKS